jgi:hypothetical protein
MLVLFGWEGILNWVEVYSLDMICYLCIFTFYLDFNLKSNWKVILGAVSKSFFDHFITFLSHLLAFCALNLPKISAELPPRVYHVLNGGFIIRILVKGAKDLHFRVPQRFATNLPFRNDLVPRIRGQE